LSDMFALLTARRNRALIQQWGVWLAGKDAERALKVGHPSPYFQLFLNKGRDAISAVIDRTQFRKTWTKSGR